MKRDARREADAIEARMRARRGRVGGNGASMRPDGSAGATVAAPAAQALVVAADAPPYAPDTPDAPAGDGDAFPRSVVVRFVLRRPKAALAIVLPAAALLAASRSTRRAVPVVARWLASPAGIAAAGAIARFAARR
ncbi:MAG: hypothetical protein AB7P21_25750 [Lautropia sp.]